MAELHIIEFERLAVDHNGNSVSAPHAPSKANQTVTIGATSAQSSAFNDGTRFVLLVAKAACHVEFGENPTATTSTQPLAADGSIFMGVNPSDKVAVKDTS